jgi:Zn-dependent protease with chaperone function
VFQGLKFIERFGGQKNAFYTEKNFKDSLIVFFSGLVVLSQRKNLEI